MSNPDQKYIRYPYVKFTNLKGENGISTNGISIGNNAGYTSQDESIAIGNESGYISQSFGAIAIGGRAGYTSQGGEGIAIGSLSGENFQGQFSVAIGWNSGNTTQGGSAVAIGNQSGNFQQGRSGIAIGNEAAYTNQGESAIAIGTYAGRFSQGSGSVAIGIYAGDTSQSLDAIAIGNQSGNLQQGQGSIAIGKEAGFVFQSSGSVAIGFKAGYDSQANYSIAAGYEAGCNNQQQYGIAMGWNAAFENQGESAIAIGYNAARDAQGSGAIAIGYGVANTTQGVDAIAIGNSAGFQAQGTNSVAIGTSAGYINQHENSIILNATGLPLNSQTKAAFYAAPIRQASGVNTLYYDRTTSEIVYEGAATIETINMSNYGQTSKLNSIPYASNQQITTSNITAKLDNWADNSQTYTFGPQVQARYVAVGTDGALTSAKTINYSADGLNWIAATSPFNTAGGYCNGIAYNGTVWVAVGSNVQVASAPSVTVAYSYDGISWINASGTTFNGTVGGVAFGVAWGKDKFVAVGCSALATPVTNTCIYSYDGINWLAASNNIFGTGGGSVAYGVCFNGLRWVVVGGQRVDGSTPSAIVGYSANGITWTSGSGTTTQPGGAFRSVAWNGQIFVMVGALAALTPGTTAYISQDGITWSSTTTSGTNVFGSASGASGFGVCWNGERWVAVGRSTNTGAITLTINYSTNGLVWTTVSTNINFNGTGGVGSAVCWTGTKFIAVGRNTNSGPPGYTVLYSYDGISWLYPLSGATIPAQGNPFSTGAVNGGLGYGIAYNSVRPNQITFPRNIVVAGGSYSSGLNTTLAYSIDSGTTWVACQNAIFGTTGGTSFCYCLATNGQIWVAGGAGSTTLGYSFDGIVWTAVNNATIIFSGNVKGIAWSPVLKLWVAVGTGTNQVAYSSDGINWVGVTLPSGGFTSSIAFDVAWGKDKFVACGGAANSNTQKFYYSLDGKTWILVTSTTFLIGAYGIGFNGSLWVAVGYGNGSTAYSYDGITWLIGSGATFSNNDFNGNGAVAWNGYRWVVCSGTTAATATVTPILYSIDGINWTASGTPSNCAGCGMVWAGNRFIAGMQVPANAAQIYTSPDGVGNWTLSTTNAFGSQCNCLAWSNSQVNTGQQLSNVAIQQPTLAFGAGTNTIAYSYDGIVWRGLGRNIFTTIGYNACWNGKLWVAVGQGTNTIAYSYDGINWLTNINVPFIGVALNSGRGVAWNGTVFVVVGTNSTSAIGVVLYSYNGLDWYQSSMISGNFPRIINCVTWGQNYFVLGGTYTLGGNTMAYSTDGITWTGLGTAQFGTAGGLNNSCNGIICGSNRWVAVGGNGSGSPSTTIYYTNNPTITWTLAVTSSTGSYTSVTFGVYPVSSLAAGTTYGTAFVATSGGSATNVFSLDGITWTVVAILGSSGSTGLTWNGKRFIAAFGGSSGIIQYSYNPTAIGNWYTAGVTGVTPTASQLFTTSINGLASSDWPTLGSVYVDNALTTSSTSGLNTNNQLDIFSDTYFNNGYNNMAATIKATQIP